MKKLLSILAAIGLTATASTAVVACGTNEDAPGSKPSDKVPAFAENPVTINGSALIIKGTNLDGISKVDLATVKVVKETTTTNLVKPNTPALVNKEGTQLTISLARAIKAPDKGQPDDTYIIKVGNLSTTLIEKASNDGGNINPPEDANSKLLKSTTLMSMDQPAGLYNDYKIELKASPAIIGAKISNNDLTCSLDKDTLPIKDISVSDDGTIVTVEFTEAAGDDLQNNAMGGDPVKIQPKTGVFNSDSPVEVSLNAGM